MERLSARKRSAIVGDYLSALSYSEIAARHHVSTGTVANVVADLKAGRFPEASTIAAPKPTSAILIKKRCTSLPSLQHCATPTSIMVLLWPAKKEHALT